MTETQTGITVFIAASILVQWIVVIALLTRAEFSTVRKAKLSIIPYFYIVWVILDAYHTVFDGYKSIKEREEKSALDTISNLTGEDMTDEHYDSDKFIIRKVVEAAMSLRYNSTSGKDRASDTLADIILQYKEFKEEYDKQSYSINTSHSMPIPRPPTFGGNL